MSRTARRTPAELLWGWGTEGEHHPGLLERMDRLEQTVKQNSRVGFVVLAALVINVIVNGDVVGFFQALKDASGVIGPLVSSMIPPFLP